MRVHRIQLSKEGDSSFELLDDDDLPIPVVSGFMRHLRARGCSPNTLSAYCFGVTDFIPSTPAVFLPWFSCVTFRTASIRAASDFIKSF